MVDMILARKPAFLSVLMKWYNLHGLIIIYQNFDINKSHYSRQNPGHVQYGKKLAFVNTTKITYFE